MASGATYLYALRCPVDCAVRYVGKANNPTQRLKQHISKALSATSKQHHCSRWIAKLHIAEHKPELVVLCSLRDGLDWQPVERLLIGFCRLAEFPLTNIASGGEGLSFINENDRAMRRERMREMGANPEFKANVSAGTKAALRRPGVKEAHSEAMVLAWAKPGAKEARVATQLLPEVREKKSRAIAAIWTNAETAAQYKAAMRAGWADPAKKEKALASRKAMWADPVIRAEMIAKQKIAWQKRKLNSSRT
jgi:hypothetical protein